MDKKKIEQIRQQYDLIIHNIENADIEFWYARELMPLLGYVAVGKISIKLFAVPWNPVKLQV